jgi:hypothetical protein
MLPTFTVGLPSVARLLLSIHSGGRVRHHMDHSFHHCRSRWVFDTCDRDRRARSPIWKWQACPLNSTSSAASLPAKPSGTAKIVFHSSAALTSSGSEGGAASHSTSSPASSEPSTSAAVPASNPSKRSRRANCRRCSRRPSPPFSPRPRIPFLPRRSSGPGQHPLVRQ